MKTTQLSMKKEKRKTSAKCRGCNEVVHGTNSTTSYNVSHTKLVHKKTVSAQSVNACVSLQLTSPSSVHL